jgi:hypothetical protein
MFKITFCATFNNKIVFDCIFFLGKNIIHMTNEKFRMYQSRILKIVGHILIIIIFYNTLLANHQYNRQSFEIYYQVKSN